MKTIMGLLVMMAISSTAFANTKSIKCSGPVGGKVSQVEGLLKLVKTHTGQMQAEGSIRINGAAAVDVVGGYDDIQGMEYAAVAPIKKSKISVLYINFNDSEDSAASYLELGNKMHPLNCGVRK